MGFKNRIANRFYNFYSSEKPLILHGILLTCIGVGGGLGNYLADSYPKLSFWLWFLAVVFFFVALILIGIRLVLLIHYRDIRLFLVRTAGILMDKRLDIRNVSFRAKTVTMVLEFVNRNGPAGSLMAMGEEIGRDFYREFAHQYDVQGGSFVALGQAEKLMELIEYDSTSGMGLFSADVRSTSPVEVEVKIRNSVSVTPPHRGLCDFFAGYIGALCSLAFNRSLRCQETMCGSNVGTTECAFRLYE